MGLRGPGETQLEVDRRSVRHEMAHLKDELEKVRARRMRHRVQRKRTRIPTVALVGYTNTGKSTLLNRLAKADIYVADQLFATLDPTTRRVELSGGYQALFTDTVGFIQKLPTSLVAAFRATLEEIAEADLLLHVVDISHPNAMNQAEAVHETLKEIEADQVPVITVLNKIDRLSDPAAARRALERFPKHRFLDFQLPRVPNVLPMATAHRFVVRAVRHLPVRRRHNDGSDTCRSVILLPIEDFHFDDIPWRCARNKDYALVGACQSCAAVDHFFDFDLHQIR